MKALFFFSQKDKNGIEEGQGSFIQFDYRRPGSHKDRRLQGTLRRDYQEVGDNIFYMSQRAISLKAVYTDRDRYEDKLFNNSPVLEDGEVVMINVIINGDTIKSRGEYRFKVNGDYSDAAIFEEI